MSLAFTLDADIALLFTDSPHAITVGEVTEPCLFDEFDDSVMEGQPGGGQMITIPRATIQTSKFPGIKIGDELSISDGAETRDFVVWNHQRIDDGALTLLFIRPVEEEES